MDGICDNDASSVSRTASAPTKETRIEMVKSPQRLVMRDSSTLPLAARTLAVRSATMPGLSTPNAVMTYLDTDGARVLAWDARARAKKSACARVAKKCRHDRDVASIVASLVADARVATRVNERTARAMSDERWGTESRSEAMEAQIEN